MELLLLKYGYLLLFLGVMFEGEAVLLAASVLAHEGVLRLPAVIVVAVLANSTIDQVYYLLARARGRPWLERRFGGDRRFARLVTLIERHGRLLLLGSRFAFGFRILIPAACGALGMPAASFTATNVLAGVLWAVPTALLGYYGGGALLRGLGDVQAYARVVPLALVALGATFVGWRHVRRVGLLRELRAPDVHRLVPWVIGLAGVLDVLSAVWPRSAHSMPALQHWLPFGVTQRSRALMLIAGLALLQVARGLARRRSLAWLVAAAALAISVLAHVGHAFDLHHSAAAGLLLAYLVVHRRRFHGRSDPGSLRQAAAMGTVLALAIFLYGYVGMLDLESQFAWPPGIHPAAEAVVAGIVIAEPDVEPLSQHAAHFLGSLQIAGWLARFYLLVLLLRPVVLRRRLEVPAEAVARILGAHGRHSLAAFAVQDDKNHLLLLEGRALVSYAVRGGVALACGEPLCAPEDLPAAVEAYLLHAGRQGWTPALYGVAEESLPACRRPGLRALKVAEEAVIDLPAFSLAGGKRAALRSMVHKVTKAGLTVRRYDRATAADPELDAQLEEISEEWLDEKRLGELGFTMGRFSLDSLDSAFTFVCALGVRAQAFCTFLPYDRGRAAVLDLMRKRGDAVSGTMDLLLAEALSELKAAGLERASLANAPLANVGEARGPLDRGVALLFENLNAFYGYKNLFQFKKKFAPRWEGRSLAYASAADLPRVAYALAAVRGSGSLLGLLRGEAVTTRAVRAAEDLVEGSGASAGPGSSPGEPAPTWVPCPAPAALRQDGRE